MLKRCEACVNLIVRVCLCFQVGALGLTGLLVQLRVEEAGKRAVEIASLLDVAKLRAKNAVVTNITAEVRAFVDYIIRKCSIKLFQFNNF